MPVLQTIVANIVIKVNGQTKLLISFQGCLYENFDWMISSRKNASESSLSLYSFSCNISSMTQTNQKTQISITTK